MEAETIKRRFGCHSDLRILRRKHHLINSTQRRKKTTLIFDRINNLMQYVEVDMNSTDGSSLPMEDQSSIAKLLTL